MAESSSSRGESKVLRSTSPYPEDDPRRRSSGHSSSGASRRQSWYEHQRHLVPPIPRLPSSNSAFSLGKRPADEYSGVDEVSAPSPVQNPDQRGHSRRREYFEDRQSEPSPGVESRPDAGPGKRSEKGKENDYENLDEVTAPGPVQNPDETSRYQRGDYLEDRESSRPRPNRVHPSLRQNRSNLTELDGPPPVQKDDDEARSRHGLYLDQGGSSGKEEAEADSGDDAASPSSGHTNYDPTPQRARASEFATQIYVYSYLIFFSFLGTLARLGVQWITFYPGAPVVESVLWANFGGSLVMGFLSEDRKLFRDEWGPRTGDAAERREEEKRDEAAAKKNHSKAKKTIPLYIGLATGFCGSFTSFSSFERDVFLALSNDLPSSAYHPASPTPSFTSTVSRNGGYSFMALLAVVITTVALSLSAVYIGAHLALALDRFTPTIPFAFGRRILDPIMVFLAAGCWLGAIILAIFPPDRPSGSASRGPWSNEVWRGEVLFALAFAPVGCLLRFYASMKLNGIAASFPLGTFAVNVFGCAIEAMCYDLQHVSLQPVAGSGRVGCQVLQGVMDGFCGCLTTVSTWVTELQGLRRRHAYFYGLATVGTGLGVMVIVMGSVRWTVGFSETACVTTRTDL